MVPKNRPRRSTGKQRATRSCQETATMPAPTTCQEKPISTSARARVGRRPATKAAARITKTGSRSRNKPRLTTTGFLRARRSIELAVKS